MLIPFLADRAGLSGASAIRDQSNSAGFAVHFTALEAAA
jgi:hypothetical protein